MVVIVGRFRLRLIDLLETAGVPALAGDVLEHAALDNRVDQRFGRRPLRGIVLRRLADQVQQHFLGDVPIIDVLRTALLGFVKRYRIGVLNQFGRQFELARFGVIHSNLLAAFEPFLNVVAERERDDGRLDVELAIVARHAARRKPMHDEQLVVVPNAPAVLPRLALRRLA